MPSVLSTARPVFLAGSALSAWHHPLVAVGGAAGLAGALVIGMAGDLSAQPATAERPAAAPRGKDAEKPGEAAAAKRKKPGAIAHIQLAGAMAEGVGQGGLLADVSPRLHRVIERLDKAAADSRVKGVILAIESPGLGRARADELRAAIARVRKAGKPVAAHLVSGQPTHYLVATACDTVAMPPAATLEITGVRAEVMFYKSLLDKVGVEAEILQVGEFKGAGEPLTRTSMSPQLRAQYEQFVGDLYDQLVERIAADRKLPPDRVRELIDTGVFTPQAAVAAGLIDRIGYEDELIEGLAGATRPAAGNPEPGRGDADRGEAEPPRVIRDYGEQKVDADFSGIGGLVKLVELLSGQKQSAPAGRERQVAVVYLTGEIREGKGQEDLFAGGAAGADSVIKAIRDAAKDDKVAAIVLRIDSPGGSALASDLIWREAERTKKPVVASLSDTAASGGYYVAVAADRIVAAPGTLTGSIGVVGGKIAVGPALEKVGVHTDVVAKGRNAGWLSTQTPFTPPEREAFLATMKDVYRLFTTKVAAGRQLDIDRVAELAEGRVFTGRMAKEAGLVDRLGTLDDAIDEAKKLAGIPADQPIERLLLPEPRGLFDDLFGMGAAPGGPAARLAVTLTTDSLARSSLLARLATLPGFEVFRGEVGAIVELATGRPLMMLPARVRVR